MGLLCRSKSSTAVCKSTEAPPANKGANLEVFKFKDLEAATGGFAKENLIVKASHGQMYRGTLQDGRVVAVKRPATPGARLWHDEDAFENEMQILSKLFSRRLVNLLGYSQDGKVKLLVVEYMVNGTLHEILHGGPNDHAVSFSWPMRVQLALQIAKAIRALHASSPPIVHRNIKSSNVFIDRSGNARLGDFGLARCVQEAEPPRRSSLLSIPEIETEEGAARFSVGLEDIDIEYETSSSSHISTKTDVFSFGMLLLEIMSGRSAVSLDVDFTPFSLLGWALPLIKQGNAMAICDPRIEPPQVTAAVKHMATIAARCVRPLGSRRPSMDEIVQGLTKASKLVPLPMWTGFPLLTSRVKVVQKSSHQNLITTRQDHTICKPSKLIRLPVWTGFLRLKKRRAFVFRLSRFFAKKFKIRTVRYTKLSAEEEGKAASEEARRKHTKGPLKGAKVSDEGTREPSAKPAANAEHLLHMGKKNTNMQPSFSIRGFHHHSSGKHFARIQMGSHLHERSAV